MFNVRFFLASFFVFSSSMLVTANERKAESQLYEVIFVDKNDNPAPINANHCDHYYQLEDYRNYNSLLQNEVSLHVGDKMLVRCSDGSDYFNSNYIIRNHDHSFDHSLFSCARTAGGYNSDIDWNVSQNGPYFLLTAQKAGTETLQFFYNAGIESASSTDPAEVHYNYYHLGSITATVEEAVQ